MRVPSEPHGKKPTTILTSLFALSAIQRFCTCRRPHQVLAGKSPDGRNWTAVASPYWPELTHVWARLCGPPPTVSEEVPSASHVAGFGFGNEDCSIDSLLSEMAFNPSGKTTVFTSAVRVAAGIQSLSRSLPTILPEFLGPEAHLACARKLQHPFARPPPISPQIARALDLHRRHGDRIPEYRSQLSALFRRLAVVVFSANSFLVDRVHRWLMPILRKRNIRFMVEVNFILGYKDHDFFVDLTFGLPMLGWARHSPVLIQRLSASPLSLDSFDLDLDSHNRAILESIGPSKSAELDDMAWVKCLEDFANGGLVGPFDSLEAVVRALGGLIPRLIRRFAILEQHGGATLPSARVIDDCLSGGQNSFTATSACHKPCDLDLWCMLLRIAAEFFHAKLMGSTSDFKSAYRQITAAPEQARAFVVAMRNPVLKRVVFGIAVSQLFGSGSAPLNFSRFPAWCVFVLCSAFGLLSDHCVDDILFVELFSSCFSGFRAWRDFACDCGWDIPDKKSPPPASKFRTLGADTDLARFPEGEILLRPAADRVSRVLADLRSIHENRHLTPAFAGRLFGRMMFASSQYFMKFGRCMLRPFSRRQHERRSGWNPQLEAACRFWIKNISCGKPREVPVHLHNIPVAVSYSDGEGTGCVGVALWAPCGKTVAGRMVVPDAIRDLWSRAMVAGEAYDIYELEAIGPALVLSNFGHLLQDCAWFHFIDNACALSSFIKGSSSVLSADCIASFTSELAAKKNLWTWFDRVDTKSNPVDGLSRGDLEGEWELMDITFPSDLLLSLRAYLHRS